METFTIDLIHTAADEHILTAYDAENNPICSLVDSGDGWEITEAVEGERLETLGECKCDLKNDFNKLHKKMYDLTDDMEAK